MDLESFAPSVDIQAEMGAEPPDTSGTPDVRIDNVDTVSHETPEESAPAEAKAEETPEKEQKVVPLAALAEARRQAKEMRERMAESEKASATAIAELNAKLERLANPPAPEPSFDENPAENLRQRQERLEAEQRAWNEERQRQAAETEAQTKQRQVIAYVNTEMEKAETEFTAKTPDYHDAVAYLRTVSEKNLKAQGVTDPATIQRITYEQALGMASTAIQQGLNPAEVAYQFAKNYGYQHKVDATRQVKAMAEAQGRTQNMGNGKPDTQFSIAALAQMNDEELAEAISDNKTWAKILKS
jgi:hypothetical protein